MQIPRSSRASLVPDQCRDNGLAVTEVRGEAREAMPQHVGRNVWWQPAELGNPLPQLLKARHNLVTAAARCGKHQVA